MGTTILSPAKISALALAEYLADEAAANAGTPRDGAGTFPFSPALATKRIANRAGAPPKSRIIGTVAEVYYRENGTRAPLSFARGKATPAAIRSAVAKRRNAGGRLGRWEVVAYSLGAALGRPVAVATVRALAREGGVSDDASYTGRGTRAGAKATRGSETAEVDSTL